MALGTEALRYEVVEGWEQLPDGWSHRDVAGVAVDSRDRVYVFNRGEHPMIVYERDGTFASSWGEGVFSNAHAVFIDRDDFVYCTDNGDHTVRKFRATGELLMTLGTPGQASETGYDGSNPRSITQVGEPFNRPTKVAVAPNGELYVSDGYGNARVHRFSPKGDLIQSWGEPGIEPGQLNLPHSVWVHTDGRVFICDRENDRIQIFSPDGELLTIWDDDLIRPADVFIDAQNRVFVGELGVREGAQFLFGISIASDQPSPARLSILDIDGNLLARWGGEDRCAPGSFGAPHGLWADSQGGLYVGEVTYTALGQFGMVPADCHTLQKFAPA
jgi:hypothetical protein